MYGYLWEQSIEAENFDNGGQNVAYYDTDAANNGGQYRTNEAVDIEICSAGGYNVGWMYSGEWLEYTINVMSTGSYNFDCRIASAVGGSFVLYIDNVDISGSLNVPNTGGWQVWQSVTKTNVNLTAGTHILKVQSNGGINLDKIIISSAQAPANTYRIKNRWQNTYLYDAGDRVRYAATATNATYNWQLESLGNGQYEIRNVSTGEYMHIENLQGYVQCTARTPGWMSSRWSLEDAGSGYVRIRNVWQSSYYIHIENLQNQAQYGTINSSWWSAMWLLEPVTGSSREPVAVTTTNSRESIQLYPNPVTDGWLRIQIANLAGKADIRIADLQGKTVLQLSTINAENNLNLTALKAGMYMIFIQHDGANFVSKLMVQ
ncbi:MAG: carbohydrate-binding protein [Bacteroidales bacterium]